MSIEEFLDEIEYEIQEQKLQKKINFAIKQKWGFSRFKRLMDTNLGIQNFAEDKRWDEDEYVKAYHQFCDSMYRNRNFSITGFLLEFYNVDPKDFIRVEEHVGRPVTSKST